MLRAPAHRRTPSTHPGNITLPPKPPGLLIKHESRRRTHPERIPIPLHTDMTQRLTAPHRSTTALAVTDQPGTQDHRTRQDLGPRQLPQIAQRTVRTRLHTLPTSVAKPRIKDENEPTGPITVDPTGQSLLRARPDTQPVTVTPRRLKTQGITRHAGQRCGRRARAQRPHRRSQPLLRPGNHLLQLLGPAQEHPPRHRNGIPSHHRARPSGSHRTRRGQDLGTRRPGGLHCSPPGSGALVAGIDHGQRSHGQALQDRRRLDIRQTDRRFHQDGPLRKIRCLLNGIHAAAPTFHRSGRRHPGRLRTSSLRSRTGIRAAQHHC